MCVGESDDGHIGLDHACRNCDKTLSDGDGGGDGGDGGDAMTAKS